MDDPRRCPRGSVWRKWDLHLHAPGTKKNDQYRETDGDVLDVYCDRIASSDVEAFGITDYFSADIFFAVVERFRKRHPRSQKALFPNVELCTGDVVNAASEEVNLHLIFNPDDPDLKRNIARFLQFLDTNKTEGHGGKRVKASDLKSASDFEEATTTRESIKDALEETFGKKADLTEHVLIFAAANNDGIRAKRGVKRKAVITDEVDKFSDGFFGSSANTGHFLNRDRLDDGSKIAPKPVITGSDAHSFSELDSWLGKSILKDGTPQKEPTWIKADLTFEGLKQITFEPADRAFIGNEPDVEIRVRENPRRYINSIIVDQAHGYDGRHGIWFKKEDIPFNKELVAIIGNKGNGKSAVTDILGLLGNSRSQKYNRDGRAEELFSFLNRDKFLRAGCASYFSGELNWCAGHPDHAMLDGDTDPSVPERVEYLPQKYLEKICANIEDDEFRHKLNQVIFEYVTEDKKYRTTTLEELIAYLTNQTSADIDAAKATLREANLKVVSLERKLVPDYRREIDQKLALKQADIEAHDTTRPIVVPQPPKGGAEALRSATEIKAIDDALAEIDREIADSQTESIDLSRIAEELWQARQTIERQVNALTALEAKYAKLLQAEGTSFRSIVQISTSYEPLDRAIRAKESRLRELRLKLRTAAQIESLGLRPEEASTAKQQSCPCRHTELENKRKEITDKLDKPDREYQAYLVAEAQWQARKKSLEGEVLDPAPDTLNWFRQELETITNEIPRDLQLARQERITASRNVLAKKKSLITFYNQVKKSVDDEIRTYGADLGTYNVSIEASLKFDQTFFDTFFRYINQQVKGSFHGTEDGRGVLRKLVDSVAKWESEGEVFQFLQNVDDHLHEDHREGQGDDTIRDLFKQMRGQKNPTELYDFLFGFDYLETKYDLKIDGKDLRELSSGERGGLLLIFYLMLDRREIPLVIDQPEDNLDNKSVYEILVRFLKKAKRRRQIILVTHNPNLAVVADAEQIIHVSIDKKNKRNDFHFRSGGIENPEINKSVVDILEGTRPAFDNRRLKYRNEVP
jgi:ABC-type lipoprotein export system ATPase subunit